MKKVRIVLALALVMMLVLQTVAFAGMPAGTVVIGDVAYDITYANAAANLTEVTQAVVNLGGKTIYVKGFDGKWYTNTIPAVEVAATEIYATTYKAPNGTQTSYVAGDVTPTPTSTPTPTPTSTPTPTPTQAPVAVAPEIVSVTNVNGNQLIVVFNNTMNKASVETIGNDMFQLRNVLTGQYANSSTFTSAVLGADGKTLTITLAAGVTNSLGVNGLSTLDAVQYRLFVNPVGITEQNKVKDTNGAVININAFFTFTGVIAADNSAPVIDSVGYASGLKKVSISANEVVSNVDASKISLTDGTRTITLSSYATVTRLSGNTAIEYVETDATKLAEMAQLTGTITVTVGAGAIEDATHNKNVLTTKVAGALVNPYVVSASYDDNTNDLSVTFSAIMDPVSITDLTRITVRNADAGLSFHPTSVKSTSSTSTIKFGVSDSNFYNVALQHESKFVVDFESNAIKSVDGIDLGAANNGKAVAYTSDNTVPTVTSVSYSANDDKLTIVFSEAMNKGSINIPAFGFVTKNSAGDATSNIVNVLSDIANNNTNRAWSNGDTKVVLKLVAGNATTFEAAAATYGRFLKFNAGAISDTNGNAIEVATAHDKVIAMTYNDDVAATAEYNNNDGTFDSTRLIKVVFTKDMNISDVTVDDFSVKQNDNKAIVKTVMNVIKTNNPKVYFLDLGTNASNQLSLGVEYEVVTNAGIKDYANTASAKTTAVIEVDTTDITAPAAPTITFVDNGTPDVQAGDKIKLVFGEPVTVTNSVATIAANTTWGSGATFAIGEYATEVLITLGSGTTFKLTEQGSATALNIAANDIRDYAANAMGAAITSNVGYTNAGAPVRDAEKAIVMNDSDNNGVISAGDTLTITFAQNLMSAEINESKITVNAGGALASTTYTATVSGKVLTLTFNNTVPAGKNAVGATVAITAAASNIKSTWNVEMSADMAAVAITPNSAVTSKPYVTEAKFDRTNRKLYITFSEGVTVNAGSFSDNNSDLDATFVLSSGYDLDTNTSTTSAAVSAALLADNSVDPARKTLVLTLTAGEFIIDEGITTINVIAGGANSAGTAIVDFDGNQARRTDNNGIVIVAK